MEHPQLSVGVLTADLTRLGTELAVLEDGDWAHVDVVDGSLCPGSTVGATFLGAVAGCGVPVDAHLLVDRPDRILDAVVASRPAMVTVQAEASADLRTTIAALAEHPGIGRGVGLLPSTPVDVIAPVLDLVDLVLVIGVDPLRRNGLLPGTGERVRAVRELVGDRPVRIGVDGGLTADTAPQIAGWEPDVVVGGSAVFGPGDARGNLRALRAALAVTAGAAS